MKIELKEEWFLRNIFVIFPLENFPLDKRERELSLSSLSYTFLTKKGESSPQKKIWEKREEEGQRNISRTPFRKFCKKRGKEREFIFLRNSGEPIEDQRNTSLVLGEE